MAALQSMRGDSVIVVGHSMGGKAALALAARQPERLVSLLLLSPSPPTPEPMSDADRAAALSGWGRLDFAEATLAKTVASPLGSRARDLALDDMLRCSAEAWRAWLETGSRENIAPAMARIALPALVLCGAMDATIVADTHRHDLLPLLHDAVLRIVPGAAHMLPIEAPVVVADAIAELIGLHAAEMRLPAASDESATLPLMRR